MADPSYGPERSIAFHVTAERTLIAWAMFALAVVLLTLALGGCS
jgi:uncharacterized membrane protein YidH (DUF202 family)